MAEKCRLCHRVGTTQNPINSHHYKGRRKYPKHIMRVHSRSCHWFAEWVTSVYLLNGVEDELEASLIAYLYNRVVTLQHQGDWILPIYR